MSKASENEKKYNDALQLQSRSFIIKKKWISAKVINGKPSICHQEFEELGFVDLHYEYEPGLKYPCKEGCYCHMSYAKYVFEFHV